MKTVTFCGHRSINSEHYTMISQKLRDEVEKLIIEGASIFLLGGYGEFDMLCAATVKELKNKYPHIKSILVVPYMNRNYDMDYYDCTEYPPIEKTPMPYAILKRNEYMVEQADVVIAYLEYGWGGAYKTYKHAQRKKKQIIMMLNRAID